MKHPVITTVGIWVTCSFVDATLICRFAAAISSKSKCSEDTYRGIGFLSQSQQLTTLCIINDWKLSTLLRRKCLLHTNFLWITQNRFKNNLHDHCPRVALNSVRKQIFKNAYHFVCKTAQQQDTYLQSIIKEEFACTFELHIRVILNLFSLHRIFYIFFSIKYS